MKFNVTFTREFTLVVEAENREALDAALDDLHSVNIDDMCGDQDWDIQVHRPAPPPYTGRTEAVVRNGAFHHPGDVEGWP